MTGRPDIPRAIAVQLTEQQWQTLLLMIGRQPFNEVAALIADITRQIQAELSLARHVRDQP